MTGEFQEPHTSILLAEVLSFFREKEVKIFVDGTVGAGGHALALLDAHPEIQLFYGIDRDPLALAIAKEKLNSFKEKVRLVKGNYKDLKAHLAGQAVDGIFLDLGVSSMQVDKAEKGFSFNKEGPLDMRMDPEASLNAAIIVNTFSERELMEIFRDYGEEPRSKRAAHAIVEARKKKPIETTFDLCEVLKTVLTWRGRKGKNIHPVTLVFQALRIRVNDELGALKEGLAAAIDLLESGGRLGVISFHSLEDRIVKWTFREAAQEGKVTILTKKPLVAGWDEIKRNPRSRSAKLRFIEKV